MRRLLTPLQWIYRLATGFRNWCYDHRLRRAVAVDAKVISVGNLTVGGTGKTPVTLALLELLRDKGYKSAVVSRGYKRRKKGIHAVDTGISAAVDFGDEPAMIKAAFPEVPVMVGERRVPTAKQLIASTDPKPDFLICDDAFQHRALRRDLNMLLLDATENIKSYRLLPVGRGREALLPALKRVDFFVLTKTNLADAEQLKDLIFWLKEKSDKPVLLAAYGFNGFRSLSDEMVSTLRDPVYLISGVAKPATVEKVIEGHAQLVKHKSFDDHHRYTHLEVEAMLDEASQLQARWLVTTAKDAVKLRAFHALRNRLWIIDMSVKLEGDLRPFYADLDRLARAGD